MVVQKFDVATMGSSILFNKPEDFGTRNSAFTTLYIVFHSQSSKNVPNFDPRRTHNYEFAWLVKFTM